MWRYTRWGGLRNVTTFDKDGRGVRKSWNSCDVIYGWPLILCEHRGFIGHDEFDTLKEWVMSTGVLEYEAEGRRAVGRPKLRCFDNTGEDFVKVGVQNWWILAREENPEGKRDPICPIELQMLMFYYFTVGPKTDPCREIYSAQVAVAAPPFHASGAACAIHLLLVVWFTYICLFIKFYGYYAILLNIMFQALMRRFQLELISRSIVVFFFPVGLSSLTRHSQQVLWTITVQLFVSYLSLSLSLIYIYIYMCVCVCVLHHL